MSSRSTASARWCLNRRQALEDLLGLRGAGTAPAVLVRESPDAWRELARGHRRLQPRLGNHRRRHVRRRQLFERGRRLAAGVTPSSAAVQRRSRRVAVVAGELDESSRIRSRRPRSASTLVSSRRRRTSARLRPTRGVAHARRTSTARSRSFALVFLSSDPRGAPVPLHRRGASRAARLERAARSPCSSSSGTAGRRTRPRRAGSSGSRSSLAGVGLVVIAVLLGG